MTDEAKEPTIEERVEGLTHILTVIQDYDRTGDLDKTMLVESLGIEARHNLPAILTELSRLQDARRRLLVKLLMERAGHLTERADQEERWEFFDTSERLDRTADWCRNIADAIERGERLEYFKRLGGEK